MSRRSGKRREGEKGAGSRARRWGRGREKGGMEERERGRGREESTDSGEGSGEESRGRKGEERFGLD